MENKSSRGTPEQKIASTAKAWRQRDQVAIANKQDAEVQRLLALGATRVEWSKRPADADYVILADPEGNRFCVVDTVRDGSGSPSRPPGT